MNNVWDWNDLAFSSKKPINNVCATFIAAARELTTKRLVQLVKAYLPHGNILLGMAKEPFVLGLEGQPQFRMLQPNIAQPLIDKVNAASPTHKIYTLSYYQRDLPFILGKIDIKKAVFVNGSWYRAFHLRPEYYTLAKRGVAYELVSPFTNDAEARAFAANTKLQSLPKDGLYTQKEMMDLGQQAARHSFAYSEFQVGVSLGRKKGSRYELLGLAHNSVVPYETYAMHHGAAREVHFSPMNDLNHYDAVHAEVMMVIKAQKERINLKGTTLFINLLPCPSCARMFTQTDISEFVYVNDHSEGYGFNLLTTAGKKVTRMAR